MVHILKTVGSYNIFDSVVSTVSVTQNTPTYVKNMFLGRGYIQNLDNCVILIQVVGN